jgi:hypothetical protein
VLHDDGEAVGFLIEPGEQILVPDLGYGPFGQVL